MVLLNRHLNVGMLISSVIRNAAFDIYSSVSYVSACLHYITVHEQTRADRVCCFSFFDVFLAFRGPTCRI